MTTATYEHLYSGVTNVSPTLEVEARPFVEGLKDVNYVNIILIYFYELKV